MWHHVDRYEETNIAEEPALSVFTVDEEVGGSRVKSIHHVHYWVHMPLKYLSVYLMTPVKAISSYFQPSRQVVATA
jgi:hypothetical protein